MSLERRGLYQSVFKNIGGGVKLNLLFFMRRFGFTNRNLFFHRGFRARDCPKTAMDFLFLRESINK